MSGCLSYLVGSCSVERGGSMSVISQIMSLKALVETVQLGAKNSSFLQHLYLA